MLRTPSIGLLLCLTFTVAAKDLVHNFNKVRLTDEFWAEGANFGDFNHDGKMDIVSGPFWYEAPDFKKAHEYYPATEKFTVKNGWLPRSTESNHWIINSVGRITDDDTDVSIAVLSHGHTSMSGGISVVEKTAKLTRQYLKY